MDRTPPVSQHTSLHAPFALVTCPSHISAPDFITAHWNPRPLSIYCFSAAHTPSSRLLVDFYSLACLPAFFFVLYFQVVITTAVIQDLV